MAREESNGKAQQPSVTVMTAKGRPLGLSKRTVLSVAVLLLVIIVGASGFAWWHDHNRKIVPKADTQEYNTLLDEQNVLSADSEYGQAANLWVSYATTTPSRAHKESAFLNAAALYMSDQQYNQVVGMCKKAESVDGVTYQESEIAANAYMSLGDKQDAIHYYQEAIRLIPASSSDRVADQASFKSIIQELQAKP